MLLVLQRGASEAIVQDVATRLRLAGLSVHRTEHDGQVRLGAVGDVAHMDWDGARSWPGVAEMVKFAAPFKLVSRTFHPAPTVITVGRCAIGSDQLALMAGPCSV